ncbi:hypothetical protein Tco_1272768 [Tanacetum coccineum]
MRMWKLVNFCDFRISMKEIVRDNVFCDKMVPSFRVSSIHDEYQIEQWLADIDAENLMKNERNFDETMGFCFDENELDMEFGFKGITSIINHSLSLMAVFDLNQPASSLSEEDDVAASNSHVVSVSSSINTGCDSFASHDDNASYE